MNPCEHDFIISKSVARLMLRAVLISRINMHHKILQVKNPNS